MPSCKPVPTIPARDGWENPPLKGSPWKVINQGCPCAEDHHSPTPARSCLMTSRKKSCSQMQYIFMVYNWENIEAQRRKWKSPVLPPPRDDPVHILLCSEHLRTWCHQPLHAMTFHSTTCFLPPLPDVQALPVLYNTLPDQPQWPHCIPSLKH